MINSTKLDMELKSVGIPIHGVNSNGVISFKDDATDSQKELASNILKKHNPEWYVEKRATAYKSVQDQLDMIYWDKVNGTNYWVEYINKIKLEFPKE